MPLREFELFHGGVITKIVRSERPVTLRLIETKPEEKWSTYTLNDKVDLFIIS
jgi:activator of HSP90 ATPase